MATPRSIAHFGTNSRIFSRNSAPDAGESCRMAPNGARPVALSESLTKCAVTIFRFRLANVPRVSSTNARAAGAISRGSGESNGRSHVWLAAAPTTAASLIRSFDCSCGKQEYELTPTQFALKHYELQSSFPRLCRLRFDRRLGARLRSRRRKLDAQSNGQNAPFVHWPRLHAIGWLHVLGRIRGGRPQ